MNMNYGVPSGARRYATTDGEGRLPEFVTRWLVVPLEVEFTSSTQWHTSHSLGRIPSVTIFDSTGKQVDAVITSTRTDVTVEFSQPLAGSLLLQ